MFFGKCGRQVPHNVLATLLTIQAVAKPMFET